MSHEGASHGYLGTRLTPAAYYRKHADSYHNPHAEGVAEVLDRLAPRLHGTVLDLGCGDGLASKLLAGTGLAFVGADNASGMVARYTRETGNPGVVAGFGDPLPPADSAVASYALHLATPTEVGMLWWRLAEAGVQTLVVVTPFKAKPAPPDYYYAETERLKGGWGPEGKTIYGVVYQRLAAASESEG